MHDKWEYWNVERLKGEECEWAIGKWGPAAYLHCNETTVKYIVDQLNKETEEEYAHFLWELVNQPCNK